MVKTGDQLKRDNKRYQVIIADRNVFVLGKLKCGGSLVNYSKPEIYSNDESINTLAELNFEKI